MLKAVEVITADALSDDEAVSVAAFPLTEHLPVLKNLAVWLKRVWAWRVLLKQHGHHRNDPFLINLEHWMKSLQLIRSQYGSRLEDLKLTRFKQGTCKHSQYLNSRVKPYMFLKYNSIFYATLLWHHWNENVIILMKFSSLAAPKVVKMTTFSAASDENFVKMMTFPFQWWNQSYALLNLF